MKPYAVFWLENGEARADTPATLEAALATAEALRGRKREGAPVSHIVLAIEDPYHVGELGAAGPAADYDWSKRRGATPGRPRPPAAATADGAAAIDRADASGGSPTAGSGSAV